MISPIERAAYALRGTGWESDYQRARAVFKSIDPDDLAQAIPGGSLGCCVDCPTRHDQDYADEQARELADAVIAHLTGKDQT